MSGGAGFVDPSSIAGLRLWLAADTDVYQDAAGTTPATDDAHPVGLWKDQSGNGYDVSQETADSRPLLKLTTNGINGKPVLLFDGTDDFLRRTVANWLSTDSAGSVVAVYNLTADLQDNEHILSTCDEGSTTKIWSLRGYRAAATPYVAILQRNADTLDTVVAATAISAATTYILVFMSSGTAWSARINGANEIMAVSAGANTGDWFADTADRDSFLVGATKTSAATALFLKGALAELIVYSSALSGANLTNTENYLADKYGVTLP
jgi:hypothetical protein